MGTIDESEIERFSRLASTWWDPDGPMRPLHRLNPVRIGYVRDRIAASAAARDSSPSRWRGSASR
jgi:2-polyprenyl-6-hydroxyphenyl methylase/3-demethylubiquinone-9 3-methyltransferase